MDTAGGVEQHTSSAEAEAKRKRAKHSKTRKGCSRCKQRHIKCDETKPACNRCVNAEYICPGFDEISSRVRRVLIQQTQVIQCPQASTIATLQRPKPIDNRRLEPIDNHRPETNDNHKVQYASTTASMEQYAVDFFTSHTLSTLAKYSPDTELWTTATFTRLITDAKIRDIIIGIGLAHESLSKSHDLSSSLNTLDCDRYYNAALAYMRMDITWVKENTIRDRLEIAVTCLLFILYLSLRDRTDEAAVHMHCGLEIIIEGGETFVTTSSVHRETYLNFICIATASWIIHPTASLLQLIKTIPDLSGYLVDLTPLQALRADFDFFAHRVFFYTSTAASPYIGDPQDLQSTKAALLDETEVLTGKLDDYIDEYGPGEGLLDPSTETIDLAHTRILRARLLIYRLFTQSVGTRYQTTYDRYIRDFDQVTTLIGHAIQSGARIVGVDWPLFSINLNIIDLLRVTNFFCRHPQIRRRALQLLQFCPQREGILDAVENMQLGRMAIEFEETGFNVDPDASFSGFVPEENRLHFVEAFRKFEDDTVDLEEDEMLVRMMYRPNADEGYINKQFKVKRQRYGESMLLC